MTGLAITGLGVVTATGVGRDAFAAAVRGWTASEPEGRVTGDPSGFELRDFDVRALLGRRGTSMLDRGTGLALVACREALADSGLQTAGDGGERVGVSLGTTTGSLRSMSDYTRDTLVEDRPYLVNPGQFPNTVMNCASGQAAIRHGLRGINSTIAGGQIAFFGVLRVTARALRLGYMDASLAGAVEEFSPHRQQQVDLQSANGGGAAIGEGGGVFVVERPEDARGADRHVDALLEAVTTGFCPGGERGGAMATALAQQLRVVLYQATSDGDAIEYVICCPPVATAGADLGQRAVDAVLGAGRGQRLSFGGLFGECGAATSSLQLAALLALHRDDPARDGHRSLLLGWTVDGGMGAAVLRGFSRPRGAEA